MSIFFILGAGASVDSGLKPYRGVDGIYNDAKFQNVTELLSAKTLSQNPDIIWNFLREFYDNVQKAQIGPTYHMMNKIIESFPDSFVMTQNIDGLAKMLSVPVIEMHGNINEMYCEKCKIEQKVNFENRICSCGNTFRPNVTLFGENLDKGKVNKLYSLIKKNKPKYVVIIGTTMQFPYIREFIKKTHTERKNRIHINPDASYKTENVFPDEKWICDSAEKGFERLKIMLEKGEIENVYPTVKEEEEYLQVLSFEDKIKDDFEDDFV